MNPSSLPDLPLAQEEELEALRSIYGPDWEDLPPTKTAWGSKKGEEGWWSVRLRGDDERVSVRLKGRFTKLYPKAAPILSIEDPVNLSSQHVSTLSKLINDKAKELSSRKDPAPFIFDISDCVIDYISRNHVPLPRLGENVPTLMEERANREQAERAAKMAQTEAVLAEERAKRAEQERLLNEKIQLDASKKAEKATKAIQDEAERKRQETLYSLADGELELRELHLDETIAVDGFDGEYDSWMLFGGKREAMWTVYTAEPDGGYVGFVKASLPTIAVQVVDFSTPFYSTPLGKKRVDAVAVELCRLKEVSCENIVRIYGVKRDKSPKGWERLIIFTEKVDGGKLKSWLPKEGFGEELAREYITQLLSGLSSVHRIGATQKQVDTTFTLLSPAQNGVTVAKLAGTGYAKRISDLDRSNRFLKGHEDHIPESWLSPDEIDSPYTYTAKRDIWHLGVLLVQLLFGHQALWRYPNLGILLQHTPGMSDSISELLNGLLHPNSKKRFTTEEALTRARSVDEVTRRTTNRHSTGPMTIAPALPSPQNVFGTSPVSGLAYFPLSMPPRGPRASRYREDFEEVEFLGKGGFGEVVKARNRLDGRSYAIKKVKLRPEDNTAKVYREVNNLSRVSHQYIVRYHACWIEDVNPPLGTPSTSEDQTTPTVSASESSGTGGDIDLSDPFAINFDDFSRRDQSRSASFPRIRFANSDSDSDEDSDADSDSSDETAADPSEQRGRSHNARNPSQVMRPSTTGTGTTTDDGAFHSILYIQMEFVEKQTLKEAILAGTLTDEEVWRLLGQILQALAHMSSLGIVHRDLKPSNILLDANGNVKIADFGLSTTEMGAVEAASVPPGVNGGPMVEDPDRTSGIGTSLYIAPEVAISRSYNEKADMYSLGVIFFEMCFAFKTHMERVHILSAIRQPSITFPAAWPKDVKPDQREIVEWLLRHDPNMRPRADQLLSSPLLPSREKQKEFYDTAIPELTNPRSSHYPQLLDALFDSQAHIYTRIEHQSWDNTYDNPTDHDEALQPWVTVVVRRLTELLQRHGAVETSIPLFIPETLLLEAFPDLAPVRLLDKTGKIIQLPSSDLLGMARSATRRQIERIKRYHHGSKYTDHISGGQPVCVGEMSFDIVSPIQSWAAEAEMLDVVDKVVVELTGGKAASADYEFHVSHESVLAGILNAVPERCRVAVLKVFKDLSNNLGSSSRKDWSTIIGLPKPLQDELQQICVPGDFNLIRHRLESLFPNAKRKMQPAFEALERIIALARSCGVSRKIIFRPTLARNAEFFRGGFMFECVKRGRSSKDGKLRELIAFGGRYDSLLDHFRAPSQHSSRKVYGVGMSIAIEPLARLVGLNESAASRKLMNTPREEDRSFGFWSPTRCDVYVAMANQVDLASRLQIVGDLWRAGISSDLQYDDERHFKEIVDECGEQNTLFIVRPQPERQGGLVKIYNVLRNSEESVPRAELCAYLRQALAEQRRIDANYAFAGTSGSTLPVQLGSGMAGLNLGPNMDGYGPNGAAGDGVRLVLPPEAKARRGERKKEQKVFLHASKQLYHKKLNDFASTVGSSIPILGVDLSAQSCHHLSLDTSWITDDELWRGILGGVQGEERKYYEVVRDQVQHEVLAHKSNVNGSTGSGGIGGVGGVGVSAVGGGGGKELKWVWLFSVREGRGFLLQPLR